MKLTNIDPGAVLTAIAKDGGSFNFPAQPSGNYRIEASHDGSQPLSELSRWKSHKPKSSSSN